MERYEIRVAGRVTQRRAAALGCETTPLRGGDTRLEFAAIDQSSLYGLLARLRDAGIELVSVERAAGRGLPNHRKETP